MFPNSRKLAVANALNVLPFLWVGPETSTAATCQRLKCELVNGHV